MTRRTMLMILIGLVSLSAVPASAGTREAVYVANGAAAIGVNTSDPAVGTIFPANGQIPRSIRISDVNGAGVSFSVCQNTDTSDANCGPGDKVYTGCTTNGTITFPAGRFVNHTTVVFVDAAPVGTPCPQVGIGGTIQLTSS